MEYNCENLFDCTHDSAKDDHEFLPNSERRWTPRRYWKKLNDVARVITQCGGKGMAWRLPDLCALLEVENDSCLLSLTQRSLLRGGGYKYVMTHSDDVRGVDVALLYNPLTFALLHHRSLHITPPKGQRATRDVLHVTGVTRSADTLHVFVLHSPSRSGGATVTNAYRMLVAQTVRHAVDSLVQANDRHGIVVLGDFNDYSYDPALRLLTARHLTEVSQQARGTSVPATYKYQGQWNSLDHILLSHRLAANADTCFIHDAPWLLKTDSKGRLIPRRTYLGTTYQGGASDHLPLVVRLSLPRQGTAQAGDMH